MNKKELLKQIEEAKNQIAKLQGDMEKMQNIIDTIDDKDNNSLPEFWLPERNEEYFSIDISELGYSCEASDTEWEDNTIDFINIMLNNVFRTEEECRIEIELLSLFAEIKEKALQEDELVPKDKMFDENTDKYFINYKCSDNKLSYSVFSKIYRQGIVPNCFFKTEEFTRKVIKEYEKRITTLLNKKYRGE